VLLQLGILALQGPLSQFFTSYDDSFRFERPGISSSFLIVLLAGALGWLGAWVSVLRHLKEIEPR
jgi:cell division transport system permease protein